MREERLYKVCHLLLFRSAVHVILLLFWLLFKEIRLVSKTLRDEPDGNSEQSRQLKSTILMGDLISTSPLLIHFQLLVEDVDAQEASHHITKLTLRH